MQDLKTKIKEWERGFSAERGRKPTTSDIKASPKEIQDAYSKYWKAKKSNTPIRDLPDDVWGESLNIRKAASKNDIKPSIARTYSERIKEKVSSSFDFKKLRHQSVGYCGSRKETTLSADCSNRSKSEGNSNADNSNSLHLPTSQDNEGTAIFADGCEKKEEQTEERRSQEAPLCSIKVLSPVKADSLPRTLYFKKSLDESWLSRNGRTEDNDDDVFATPSTPLPRSFSHLTSRAKSCSLFEKGYMTSKIRSISRPSAGSTGDNVFSSPLPVAEVSSSARDHSSLTNCDNDSNDCSNSVGGLSSNVPVKASSSIVSIAPRNEDSLDHTVLQSSSSKKRTSLARAVAPKTADSSEMPLGTSIAIQIEKEGSEAQGSALTRSVRTTNVVIHTGSPKKCGKEEEGSGLVYAFSSEVKTGKGSKKRKREQAGLTKQPQKTKRQRKKSSHTVLGTDSGELETTKDMRPKSFAKSSLERKIEMGTVNENYVRINLKKKKFSRGHHKLNTRKFKFQQWKEKKRAAAGDGTRTTTPKTTSCFKCGEVGHWARSCPGIKCHGLEEDADTEVPALPTLEEAAQMACGIRSHDLQQASQMFSTAKDGIPADDSSALAVDQLGGSIPPPPVPETDEAYVPAVEPFMPPGPDGQIQDTPDIVYQTLFKMGFSAFRPGQEAAIKRILSGLSTLVVSSTGSGKSLCYQLPAYIYAQKYECITLVISPLISLMEDQVVGLPPCLKAAFLHSAMPATQKAQVLERMKARDLHFLLVSPEMLVQSTTGGVLNHLPHVAFACIDEAHCLSQWSHNFRPSYLQLYKILTTRLNIKCILALTATATESTCISIAKYLGIEDVSEGIIGRPRMPDNLILSVSEEEHRDEALIGLLKGPRLSSCESVIVYCTRREETERLASLIRINLQRKETPLHKAEDVNQKGKGKKQSPCLAWEAEAYHAGMTSYKRRSIQKKFMTGKLRVVVATVAFGMGIDKADIRAIIHYNMPRSFENYVQEAGRAGRDGLVSHCHLFLEREGKDQNELKRHIYANSTDRHVLRKLLRRLFTPVNKRLADTKNLATSSVLPLMYEVAVPIDATVEELDLKEENILTLMCFLEFHPKKVLEVLNRVYATCTIRCYGGPKQLRAVASKSPPVAAAMALACQRGEQQDDESSFTFPVVDVAAYMGWDSKLVKRDLKRLEWDNSMLHSTGRTRKTGVIVEFSDLSFHVKVATNLSAEDQDDLLDYLHSRIEKQEKAELQRLKQVYTSFQSMAYMSYTECIDSVSLERSQQLKGTIQDYFSEKMESRECNEGGNHQKEGSISSLQQDIRALVSIHQEHKFNGRAIARIFHGISSPCFPAEVWGRVRRFWRSNLHFEFNTVVRVANQELMQL